VLPATTGSGLSAMETSATSAGVVVDPDAVALFGVVGSDVAEETVAVFAIVVPSGAAGDTCVVSVNCCGVAGASVAVEQSIVVVPLQLHPAGGAIETNCTCGGSVSVMTTLAASLGPLFVTVIV